MEVPLPRNTVTHANNKEEHAPIHVSVENDNLTFFFISFSWQKGGRVSKLLCGEKANGIYTRLFKRPNDRAPKCETTWLTLGFIGEFNFATNLWLVLLFDLVIETKRPWLHMILFIECGHMFEVQDQRNMANRAIVLVKSKNLDTIEEFKLSLGSKAWSHEVTLMWDHFPFNSYGFLLKKIPLLVWECKSLGPILSSK